MKQYLPHFNPIAKPYMDTYWYKIISSDVAYALYGSLFIILGAHLRISFWPVPMTLQTFFIASMSLALPLRVNLMAISLYVVYGLLGAPVFANGMQGLAYFMSPNVGYIVGFFSMSILVGMLKKLCNYRSVKWYIFFIFRRDRVIWLRRRLFKDFFWKLDNSF